METHIFNEEKKRLEPIDNRCMCCGNGFSRGEEDNFYLPLYKEKDRTNVVVYRSVKYSMIKVGVARCPECGRIHKQVKTKAIIMVIILSILSLTVLPLLGWGLTLLLHNTIPFFVLFFIGMILIFVMIHLYPRFEQRFARQQQVLSRWEAAMEYDLVSTLLNDGWTFEQPLA